MNRLLADKKSIVIFMLPATLVFLGVMVVPIFATFYYSALSWDGIGQAIFVGADNYVKIIGQNTYKFWQSVGHSFIVLILSLAVQEVIALCLALILARGIKGESFFRTAFFVPVVLSTIVIAQMFMKIYHPDYGLLNVALRALGLEAWTHSWLAEPNVALWAVFLPLIWQFIGYHMLLFYGAIKSIPEEILEAAKIDGANYVQVSLKIILPLILPMIETCVVVAVVGSLKTFDFVFVMTGGGPMGATEMPSTLMYDLLIKRSLYGEGSTVAAFIVVECLVFTVVLQYIFRKFRATIA